MGAPRVTFWYADEYAGIYLDDQLIYDLDSSAVGYFADNWLAKLIDELGIEIEVDSFENIDYVYENDQFPERLKEEHRNTPT